MSKRNNKAYPVAFIGVMLAAALLLGYVESLFPYDFAVPGIKLGLPNLLTLIVLKKMGIKTALPFGLLRAAVSNVLFGSVLSLVYAMAGCILSVICMWLIGKVKFFGVAGQSVAGGVAHNIGQIVAAIALLGTPGVLYYTPFLMISGAVTGFVIGVGTGLILERGKQWFEFG